MTLVPTLPDKHDTRSGIVQLSLKLLDSSPNLGHELIPHGFRPTSHKQLQVRRVLEMMAPKVIEIRHAKIMVWGYHDFGTRRHATAVLNLFIAKQPITKDQSSDCWLSHHAKNQLGATSFSSSLEKKT